MYWAFWRGVRAVEEEERTEWREEVRDVMVLVFQSGEENGTKASVESEAPMKPVRFCSLKGVSLAISRRRRREGGRSLQEFHLLVEECLVIS